MVDTQTLERADAGMLSVPDARELARDNDLIQAAYSGSAVENRILLQAMYDYQQTGSRLVTYSADDMVRLLNLSPTNHTYDQIRTAINKLMNKGALVTITRGGATMWIHIITSAVYENGRVSIKLNDDIKPFLHDIKNPYTKMCLSTCMRLGGRKSSISSSSFSIRLYEILRTRKYLLERDDAVVVTLSLAELKIRTGLVNIDDNCQDIIDSYGFTEESLNILGNPYPRWIDFRKRVLDPAVEEINDLGSISVEYIPQKIGRAKKVSAVKFVIRKKKVSDADDSADTVKNDVLQAVKGIIQKPMSDYALSEIVKAAGGDLLRIQNAYNLACSQSKPVRDLARWMIAAIKGGWRADDPPVSIPGSSGTSRAYKNPFNNFEQNEYDFDALENEIVNN